MTDDAKDEARRARSTRRKLDACARSLEELRVHAERAVSNLRDWSANGYPSGTGESSIGGGRVSDPVAAEVVAHEQRGPDPFRPRLAKILGCIDTAAVLLDEAAKIARENALTVSTQAKGEASCELCATAAYPHGAHECGRQCAGAPGHLHPARFQRVYTRRTVGAGTTRIPVCSWHSDFLDAWGVRPALELVLYHLDHPGGRVPWTLIREHHPAEFKARRGTRAEVEADVR